MLNDLYEKGKRVFCLQLNMGQEWGEGQTDSLIRYVVEFILKQLMSQLLTK
jgi:hypothetical protein